MTCLARSIAVLIAALALTAIVTIASKRIGWTNYWGGFVYAPFALIVAVLLATAMTKKGDKETRQ